MILVFHGVADSFLIVSKKGQTTECLPSFIISNVKLLLDELLTVLDNDPLVVSVNLLTSEVVTSAVSLCSLHVLDAAATTQMENLYRLNDRCALEVTALEQNVCASSVTTVLGELTLDILEVACSSNREVILEV